MITLTIISILYSIFGLIKFKKIYGHYTMFDEDPKLWTMLLLFTTIFSLTMGMFFIIKYLP